MTSSVPQHGMEPAVFRALLDKASDAIMVTDETTLGFIYANEAAVRMHGYSHEEILSMSARDIDPDISRSRMRDIHETLRRKRSVMFEGVHRRRDGSRFPVEVHLSLVRVDGRDWRLAMVRDVTERRRAETDLQLFRALLDRASDAIEVVDPETLRYLDANETASRILGYSREELLAMSVWDVDTEMDGMDVPGLLRELRAGRPVTLESTHRRKDGSTFPVEIIVSQVWLDRAYNIVVARDISERKREEALSRERQQQLQEAQEFGHLGHWSWQADSHRVTVSDEVYRILGLSSPPTNLSVEGFLRTVHTGDRQRIRDLMQSAVKTSQSTDAHFRIVKPDGAICWIHEKSTTSVDAHGNPERVFGICQDVTEQQEHAETLRHSLEQSILTIADTVEARDPYTAGHQRRVGELAQAIAVAMQLPEDQVQGIHLASLIHDLGKIHIPAEILSKPGRLSDAEYMMIKTHPQAGYDIVKKVKFPWPIADIILQHHERLDGSGYPLGLKGDQILPEARIIAVADVVESMTSHRPYRAGLGLGMALEEIEAGRGRLYDAEVVDTCLRLFRHEGYAIAGLSA